MNTAAATKFFSIFSPTRITGPIFDKELRVASRRKRTYLLRLIYILAITVFIGLVWFDAVENFVRNGYSVLVASQMSKVGKMIITNIVWFQFYTMPVLAVILLSSSISSEIQGKTIGVLVSTPITSFQIVMGKMLSKLFQLILLMAISVPILSMVRVFGGVPWNYIISTFCVTLSLTIFAASVSLFLSIYIKKPFVVIPVVIILFAIMMAIARSDYFIYNILKSFTRDEVLVYNIAYCLSPHLLLDGLEYSMKYPGRTFVIRGFIWQLHCGISLLFSALVLIVASFKVRKVALMQVSGELGPLKRWLNTESKKQTSKTVKPKKQKPIRTISDNPVIWREARSPVFVKRKFLRIAAMIIVSVGSVVMFIAGILIALMNTSDHLQIYTVGFMVYGTIFTVIFPASCIPAEKESRSWVMLMSTSLTDWQILFGKFVGIVRKCMFPWTLLLLFLLYTSALQVIHPITIIYIALSIISIIAFLSGTGLFVGTLFRKANAAVVANIVLAATVWAIIPIIGEFLGRRGNDIQLFCVSMNPFYQASVVMDLANFRGNLTALEYRWPMELLGPGMTLLTITISTIIHIATGAFFIFCAKKRLRKNIF